MPSITGILETALYVADVNKAAQFYQEIFGFEKMVCDDRFCALNVAGKQVLLLFRRGASLAPVTLPGGTIPYHDGQGPVHFAFSIPDGELETWEQHLLSKGVAIESKVQFPHAWSIYFRDTDDHLVELTTPAIWPGLK